mmetsp:Transcript_18983/g.55222  ORF Transcript_18983/g.55222 Transcript_18983/m.55222 type:complete len:627 (-) Transcript_18983:336-2216(-)
MALYEDWSEFEGYDGEVADVSQWVCDLCRFKNSQLMPVCEVCSLKRGEPAPVACKGRGDPGTPRGEQRALILGESKLVAHEASLRGDAECYAAELALLLDLGVPVPSANMPRIAAALVAVGAHTLFDRVLAAMTVAEVVAFAKFLDAPRKVRQLRRRIQALKRGNTRRKTVRALERTADQLEAEGLLASGSMTGSIARKVRRKVSLTSTEELEFFLLMFPAEPWKELSDLCHFKPSDFKLSYFLPAVHGEAAPLDSLTAQVRDWARGADAGELSTEQRNAKLLELLDAHPSLYNMYSFLRRTSGTMSDEVKLRLARHAPLEDVLWFYEEMDDGSGGVEAAVEARLAGGEGLDAGRGRANYGKLMERLLLFRRKNLAFVPHLMKYAEEQLQTLAADETFQRDAFRVAVLGDASGSMEVAINTSTILGSLLSVCLDAELHFFNDLVFPSPIAPTSAADVLQVTESVPATGLTSPAAALLPFYEQKKPVDLFVVVSDEEENTPAGGGLFFAELFQKYQKEVNPRAGCFLVSFLSGPSSFLGKMNASLQRVGIRPRQFRLDGRRPDLSRLSNLLAMLRMELKDATGASKAEAAGEHAPACSTGGSGGKPVEAGQKGSAGAGGTAAAAVSR